MYKRSDWLQNFMSMLSETMAQGVFGEVNALVIDENDGVQLFQIVTEATSDFDAWKKMREYKCKQPTITLNQFTAQFEESPAQAITVLYRYLCPPSAIKFIRENSITPEELYYFHLDKPDLQPLRAISEIALHKA